MSKKEKAWMFALIFLMIMDIIMHFSSCNTDFSYHLNYIASVMLAFTIGLSVADTPRFRS